MEDLSIRATDVICIQLFHPDRVTCEQLMQSDLRCGFASRPGNFSCLHAHRFGQFGDRLITRHQELSALIPDRFCELTIGEQLFLRGGIASSGEVIDSEEYLLATSIQCRRDCTLLP